jgi:hypothetical protein
LDEVKGLIDEPCIKVVNENILKVRMRMVGFIGGPNGSIKTVIPRVGGTRYLGGIKDETKKMC